MFVCTGICVPVSLLCCQDAASLGSFSFHLLAGGVIMCVCTLMYVYVCVCGHMRTCITSVLVKMFHLLAGGVIMCACIC